MSPARFRWGIILILLGLLIFLQNINVLDDYFWTSLAFFIPVLLIAVGVEKIFTKTRLQFISYLTSIVILVGGLAFAFSSNIGDRAGSFFSESQIQRMHDEDVKYIIAEIEVDETALTIRDSGDDIVFAKFDRFTRKPDVKYDIMGDTAELKFLAHRNDLLGGIVKMEVDQQQDWMISFSRSIPLKLVCKGDGADVHLNMATTPLENLELDLHDSYIYLKLGDLIPNVRVKISGDDSRLKLRIPGHVGVKVNAAGYESYFEHVGLKRSNGWYISGGIDSVKSKVEIDLGDKLSSFSIDYF